MSTWTASARSEGESAHSGCSADRSSAFELSRSLAAWQEQAAKLEKGEITKEDYDRWRYRYPEYDTSRIWAKVPSQQFSDWLVDALKEDK